MNGYDRAMQALTLSAIAIASGGALVLGGLLIGRASAARMSAYAVEFAASRMAGESIGPGRGFEAEGLERSFTVKAQNRVAAYLLFFSSGVSQDKRLVMAAYGPDGSYISGKIVEGAPLRDESFPGEDELDPDRFSVGAGYPYLEAGAISRAIAKGRSAIRGKGVGR